LASQDRAPPRIIIGKDIINKIQINSNALKNIMVKIPNKIIKTPPNTCFLNAIKTKIKSKTHGKEFGIFLKNPLFSEPDSKANPSQNMAITNNRYFTNTAIFCLSILITYLF